MTKHSACSSMDPNERRAAGVRVFEILGAKGTVMRVIDNFYDAKKALDNDPEARSVRCPLCGSLMASKAASPAGAATESFVRYIGE